MTPAGAPAVGARELLTDSMGGDCEAGSMASSRATKQVENLALPRSGEVWEVPNAEKERVITLSGQPCRTLGWSDFRDARWPAPTDHGPT